MNPATLSALLWFIAQFENVCKIIAVARKYKQERDEARAQLVWQHQDLAIASASLQATACEHRQAQTEERTARNASASAALAHTHASVSEAIQGHLASAIVEVAKLRSQIRLLKDQLKQSHATSVQRLEALSKGFVYKLAAADERHASTQAEVLMHVS